MAPKYFSLNAAELDFDVTQQIDPALADLMRQRSDDVTALALDFDEPEIAIDF